MHRSQFTTAQTDVSSPTLNQDILTAAKGGGILFIGSLFEQASRFIFAIIVARSLGAAGFGFYGLGMSVTIILATIATLGLPGGVVRFLPTGLQRRDTEWIRGILFLGLSISGAIGLGLAIVMFGLADFLAIELFHEAALSSVLRWFSICIPLEAIGQVLIAATLGLNRVQYQVYGYSIAFYVLKIGLSVVFVFIGLGVEAIVAAHALAWLITIGFLLFLLNQLIPLRQPRRIAKEDIRKLMLFSAPLCLTEITIQLRGYVDLILIGMMGTMVSVGVYSSASRVQMAGNLFMGPIANMAKPIISGLHHQDEMVRLRRLYQTLTRWSLSFILPFVITVIVFAQPILAIFGDEFIMGVPVLIIVCIGLLINGATRICHSMISMTGHSRLTFLNTTAGLIINVILDLILIPVWGIFGAAFATTFSVAIIGIARLIEIYKLVKLWPYNLAFIKPLLASGVALLVAIFASRLFPAEGNLFYLALDTLALWSAYVVTIILLGLSEDDFLILSRVGKRFSAALFRG